MVKVKLSEYSGFVSLLSGDGKPPVESLISALKILLVSMTLGQVCFAPLMWQGIEKYH